MIDLRSINFYDEFTGVPGGGIDYENANIGDKITVNLVFDTWWRSKLLSLNSKLTFKTTGGITTITRNDGGSFIKDGFQKSDTFITTECWGATDNNGISMTVSPVAKTQQTTLVVSGTDTITRSDFGGNFINDGFKAGMLINAFNMGANDAGSPFTIIAVTQTTITSSGLTNGTFNLTAYLESQQVKVSRSDSGGSYIKDGFGVGVDLQFYNAGSNLATTFTTESVSATEIVFLESDILVNETADVYLQTDLTNDGNTFLIDTISVSTIVLDASTPAILDGEFYKGAMHGNKPITGMDYFYNQIENSSPESYESLTDLGATQKYNLGGLDGIAVTPNTLTDMVPQYTTNSSGYIDNYSTKLKCSGAGLTQINGLYYYVQQFEVEQIFIVSPLFLASQFAAFTISNPKISFIDYLKGALSLKYIAKVVAKLDNNANIDKNYPHQSNWTQPSTTGLQLKSGNVGWFNEKFNGGNPEYTLFASAIDNAGVLCNGVSDQNQIDITSANSLFGPITGTGTITATVISPNVVGVGTLFTTELIVGQRIYNLSNVLIGTVLTITDNLNLVLDANAAVAVTGAGYHTKTATKCVLNFMYLPKLTSQYIGTPATTLLENFKFDRVLLTEGAAPANGDNFGDSDYQVITDALCAIVAPDRLQIQFTIDLGANLKDFFKTRALDDRYFVFWVSTQNQAITTTANTDRNNVIGIVDNFVCDLDDDSLLTFVNSATPALNDYQSFYEDGADTFSGDQKQLQPYANAYSGYIGDNIYSEILFKILKGSEGQIKTISMGLIALNQTKTVAEQKLYYIILDRYDKNVSNIPVSADQQDINVNELQNFVLKSGSLFKDIKIVRVPSLDDGTHVFYKIHFGFKGRYEEWRKELNNLYAEYPNVQVSLPLPRTKNYSVYGNITAFPNGNRPDGNGENWILCFLQSIDVEAPVTQPNIETIHTTTFQKISAVVLLDDAQLGIENITLQTKTYLSDAIGTIGTEITPNISDTQHTLVRNIFTKNVGNFLTNDVNLMYGIVSFDIKGLGGINFLRQSNSDDDREADTFFVGISGTSRAKKTLPIANVFIVEDVIEPTKMLSEVNKAFGVVDFKANPVVLSGRCDYNIFYLKQITYTPVSGTFQVNKVITGGTSGAIGLIYEYSAGVVKVKTFGGFIVGETLTQISPAATGTFISITDL